MLKIIFAIIAALYLVLTIYAFASNKPKKTKISSTLLTVLWIAITGVLFFIDRDSASKNKTIALDAEPLVFDYAEITPTKVKVSGTTATFYFDYKNTDNTERNFLGSGVTVVAEQDNAELSSNYEEELERTSGQLHQKIKPVSDLEIEFDYDLKNETDPVTFNFRPLEGNTQSLTVEIE